MPWLTQAIKYKSQKKKFIENIKQQKKDEKLDKFSEQTSWLSNQIDIFFSFIKLVNLIFHEIIVIVS